MSTYHFIYGMEVRLVYRIPKSEVTWNVYGSLRLKLYFVRVFDSSTTETCSNITTALKMIRRGGGIEREVSSQFDISFPGTKKQKKHTVPESHATFLSPFWVGRPIESISASSFV
jgi:hypothetical protein